MSKNEKRYFRIIELYKKAHNIDGVNMLNDSKSLGYVVEDLIMKHIDENCFTPKEYDELSNYLNEFIMEQ